MNDYTLTLKSEQLVYLPRFWQYSSSTRKMKYQKYEALLSRLFSTNSVLKSPDGAEQSRSLQCARGEGEAAVAIGISEHK